MQGAKGEYNSLMSPIVEIHLGTIKPEYISRYLGYDESHMPSPLVVSLINSESRWLHENIKSRGIYEIFPCKLPDDGTVVVNGKAFGSKVLRMHLEGSIFAAALAVTMGVEVDERITGLMEQGQAAQSYIFNGMAAAATDCAADVVEMMIREIVKKGGTPEIPGIVVDPAWKATRRFSPGYADFVLENQASMFELLNPGRIGLRLTSSSLMIPLKSITALIGVGPDVKTEGYPCDICDRCNITECRYIDR